jgi:hypothetical protein
MHGDDVARLRKVSGVLDRAQRGRLRAGVGVLAARGNVKLGGVSGNGECDDA